MKNLITKKEVFKIIAKSLEVSEKKINENVTSNNLEEWDSVNHLNLLIALDKILSGKTQKIKDLSESYSVKKIINILKKKKLLK